MTVMMAMPVTVRKCVLLWRAVCPDSHWSAPTTTRAMDWRSVFRPRAACPVMFRIVMTTIPVPSTHVTLLSAVS